MSSHLDPLLMEQQPWEHTLGQNLPLYVASIILIFSIAYAAPLGLPPLFRILEPLGVLHATAGCERIGLSPHESNLLRDEYSEEYDGGATDGSGKSWRVKSLWIYPIKSCAGVELASSPVVKTGLDYDRHFLFAHYKPLPPNAAARAAATATLEKPGSDGAKPMAVPAEAAARWEFATIREYSRMVHIRAELWLPDPKAAGYSPRLRAVRSGGVVRVVFPYRRWGLAAVYDLVRAWFYGDAPGTLSFCVPYRVTDDEAARKFTKGGLKGATETVKIWKDFPSALNMAPYVPQRELQAYLGSKYPMTLFRSTQMREIYRDAPRKETLGWQPVAAFNDAYPINLLGLASVHDVDRMQDRTKTASNKEEGDGDVPRVSARRFRANIVVQGTPAYEEEKWQYVRIGEAGYHVVARCARCKIPNVDPDSGRKHRVEPDRTLRKFRDVDAGVRGVGCLAVQLVPDAAEGGAVAVGDVIHVVREGEHVYTPM